MTPTRFVLGAILAASLSLCVSGCGAADGGASVGSQQQPVTGTTVTWTNPVGVDATVAGNLTKTGATGWNAGAASNETITGDGYVTFTTAEANTYKMAGLSNGDTDQSYGDIDFAVYLKANGGVGIYENGVSKGAVSTYVAGDVFKVDSTGGVIRYYQNGILLYKSTATPAATLLVDTSLYSAGSTIQNATVVQSVAPTFWQNVVGVTANGSSISKSGTNAWNAGASSTSTFTGDGYVTFTTAENTTYKMAGLSSDDANQNYTDIDFGIYLQSNGKINIYEGGVNRGTKGTYVANDVFKVDSTGGVVTYFKNGSLLYTSTLTPAATLLLDTSLYSNGATINSATITGAAPPAFWQNEVKASSSGNNLTKSGPAGWTSGASSVATIAGDGYIEFTTGENNTYKMAGLSNGDTDQSYGDIDFAVYLQANGNFGVYEGGVNRGMKGTYVANDIFRVQNTGGVVTYYKNGGLFYTSAGAPTAPLLLDTSLYSTGATINGAVVHSGP